MNLNSVKKLTRIAGLFSYFISIIGIISGVLGYFILISKADKIYDLHHDEMFYSYSVYPKQIEQLKSTQVLFIYGVIILIVFLMISYIILSISRNIDSRNYKRYGIYLIIISILYLFSLRIIEFSLLLIAGIISLSSKVKKVENLSFEQLVKKKSTVNN